jgi:hypothetical protein
MNFGPANLAFERTLKRDDQPALMHSSLMNRGAQK